MQKIYKNRNIFNHIHYHIITYRLSYKLINTSSADIFKEVILKLKQYLQIYRENQLVSLKNIRIPLVKYFL